MAGEVCGRREDLESTATKGPWLGRDVALATREKEAKAVEAIRKATRLGSKKMIKVLEAIVQEADAVEMEA